MTDTPINVHIKTPNAKTRFQLEAIIGATEGFKVLPADDKTPAEILIMELGDNLNDDFQIIEALTGEGKAVFVTATTNDPNLLLQAMRSGAGEYFSQPIDQDEVFRALSKFREKTRRTNGLKKSRQGTVLQVAGCKGGVGTTTLAVNLAAILAKREKSVCLIDMNMAFGEVPLFLDVKPTYTWAEVLRSIDRLDATYLMNVVTHHPSGIHLLASPNSMNGSMTNSSEKLARMIAFIRKTFDYTIIDTGQALNDVTLKIFETANDALLVSTLSIPSLANTTRFIQMLSTMEMQGGSQIKVIINRFHKKTEISPADAEKSLSAKIYWKVPNDYRSATSSINQGKPLIESFPKSSLTKNLTELAASLYETEKSAEGFRWNIFGR